MPSGRKRNTLVYIFLTIFSLSLLSSLAGLFGATQKAYAVTNSTLADGASVTATFVDRSLIKVTASGSYLDQGGQAVPIDSWSGYYYNEDSNKLNYTQVGSSCASGFRISTSLWEKRNQQGNQLRPSGDYNADPITIDFIPQLQQQSSAGSNGGGGCITPVFDQNFYAKLGSGAFGSVVNPSVVGTGIAFAVKVANPAIGGGAPSSEHVANITYFFVDNDTIVRSDGDPNMGDPNPDNSNNYAFKSIGGGYYKQGVGTCPDIISFNNSGGNLSVAEIIDQDNGPGTGYDGKQHSDCHEHVQTRPKIYLMGAEQHNQVAPPTIGNGGTGPGSSKLDCENNGGPLGWFVCPVIRAVSAAASWFDDQIETELTIKVSDYFGDSSAPLYKLWSTFRTLALSLLVLISLIMVISQAMNFGPFDAYTVKKVLPRILAAVILISLSWELGKFFVQMSNDFGSGVRDLINSLGVDKNVTIGGISGLLTSGVAIAGGIALGALGALSFILTAMLALLVGLLIIIFRRLIVVMCVVTAPIALVAFILPNTEKVWKFWKDSFQGALLVFPLITGFIATGHLLASIDNHYIGKGGTPTGGEGILNVIVVLILYIGPYFALPLVFKFATGIMSTLAGMANDRGRGAFDRLKGYRQKKTGENMHALKTGSRFAGKDWIPGSTRAARRFNAMSRGASSGFRGSFGLGTRGAQANAQAIEKTADEYMKDANWVSIKENDWATTAATYDTAQEGYRAVYDRARQSGMNEQDATNTATDAVRAVQAGGYKFGDRALQFAAAKQRVLTGTGYGDMADMVDTLARVSHGSSSSAASLSGFSNAAAKQVGRPDLAPSYGTLNNLVRQQAGISEGGPVTHEQIHNAEVAATRSMDAVSLLRGKTPGVRNHARGLQEDLNANLAVMQDANASHQARSEASESAKRIIGQINQLDANKSYASADNQQVVNELVADSNAARGQIIDILRSQPNAQEHMEDINRYSAPPQGRDPNDPRRNNDDNAQPPGP